MEVTRPQPILATSFPPRVVLLRQVSGLRGAVLIFLPLLLLVGSLSATLLVASVIDTSAQLWLWTASWVLFFALSCVCYVWIYRCRRQTRIEMPGTPPIFTVTTPFLGAWNFPMQRLIGFQFYTSETARKRQREFFIMLALSTLAAYVILFLYDWRVFLFVIPLVLIGYPLLQNNKPSPFYSGIVLYFAKTNNLRSPVHAPISIHICADDTIVQNLASIAKMIIEQNSKSTAVEIVF